MIGFEAAPQSERGHPNEDPETRSLDKKEFYTLLINKFYLPPYNSRGINRDYLLKVYKQQCYQVMMLELKHFEVELTPSMVKRVGIQNNSLLLQKMNLLLLAHGKPGMGFEDYDPPEEVNSVD